MSVAVTDTSFERAYGFVAESTDESAFVLRVLRALRMIFGEVTVAYIDEKNCASVRYERLGVEPTADAPAASLPRVAASGAAIDLDAPFYESRGSYGVSPLLRGPTILGWLYVASDSAHFDAACLDRLSSFASFAALTLESLRAAGRERAAALTDSLTGLANRRALDAHVAERLNRPEQPFAFCLFDLNDLKKINDGHGGHAAGDRAIQACATALKVSVRSSDLVARLGGDEFVAVLSSIEPQAFIERVRARLEPSGYVASAGYALYPNDATTAETLYKLADAAMYQSKTEIKKKTVTVIPLSIRRRTSD